MGQLAKELSDRKQGEFPAQPLPNPRGHQQLNAVTILRSGKIIGIDESARASLKKASTSKVSEIEKVMNPHPSQKG